MEHIGSSKDPVDVNLVRHMILNSIRSSVKKFKAEYGSNIVIACDDRKYWRREIFPHYKGKRAKSREESGHDWTSIFSCIETVKEELYNYSPYIVLQCDTAEADDIIGVLVTRFSPSEKVMIISGDKDFVQLHNKNVKQYSPILKKFVESEYSAKEQLRRLIIKGDTGDGIPNILSADDSIMTGTRQKSIYEAKLVEWVNQDPKTFCDDVALKKFLRNESLIDLSKIPDNIQQSIIYKYDNTKPKTKMQFMNYLVSKRLTNLLGVADEF